MTRKKPELGEPNRARDLKKEQERFKLLIPQKVQEVTVTTSNVSKEEVEDVWEDFWGFTRVEVTDVRRKSEDDLNIDSDNESEYDSETD